MTGDKNDKRYEELCRYFLASQLGIGIDKVVSVEIPNPRRGDLPQYKHQVDLYWETEGSLTLYLNIANAKWRGSEKVKQGEVMLLQQVKQKVAAHKVVMLTNSEFTAGALAAAQDDGIALHIVRPKFDPTVLSPKDVNLIRQEIQDLAAQQGKPPYFHEVVHKAFDLAVLAPPSHPVASPITAYGAGALPSYSTKVMTDYPNEAIGGGGAQRGGGGFGGGPSKGSGGPGYRTK